MLLIKHNMFIDLEIMQTSLCIRKEKQIFIVIRVGRAFFYYFVFSDFLSFHGKRLVYFVRRGPPWVSSARPYTKKSYRDLTPDLRQK